MLTLNSRLNTIGISSAKGVDLVMQRDQLNATLPSGGSTSTSSKQEATAEARREVVAKGELTPEQQRQVRELQQIDRAVREHEQAHLRAGRDLVVGRADFAYTYGPDGKQYAVAGEVAIDTSAEREPVENIDKGIRIQATALAPRDPSPQDYSVARAGAELEGQGRRDLVRQQQEERLAAELAARARERAAADGATAAVRIDTFA